ncbi:MAG TPA: DUF6054 family protein [Marmoricola sp.]|jgi:hypothetical protein|nr:DUF6054 family protein [Marmoricola sp.]
MAHFERTLIGDLTAFVDHLDEVVVKGSVTAKLEDTSDVSVAGARMVVRTYERYSAFGGNRVSLGVSVLAVGDQLAVSASAAGGSEAMFFKINTVGEDSFLEYAVRAVESFDGGASSPAVPLDVVRPYGTGEKRDDGAAL